MRETNSQGKAYVVPLAVAAGLGMAGMGLVSSGIVSADTTSITDTVNVEVQPSCTFNNVIDETYVGSALNGSEVENFHDAGVHIFYLFCNNNDGYTVSATPHNLTATGIENDAISYTNNYTHTGTDGMWTAEIATSESGVTVTSPVPIGGGVIISSNTNSSDSMSFTATYSAYVGSRTPAGTYTGTIEYTLSSLDGSASNGNNGNSGSGGAGQNDNNGNGENDPENEAPDNIENGGGSGDSGSGDSGSGNGDQNTSSNTPAAAPKNAPAATVLNSSYSTYNTTNYASGGANTTGTQVATSGDTNDTTSGNSKSKSDSTTNDGYENPLGVTTTTTSSNEDAGVDPMPIIAAGAALAVAGVAAIAIARSNKEEQ